MLYIERAAVKMVHLNCSQLHPMVSAMCIQLVLDLICCGIARFSRYVEIMELFL